MRVVLQNQRNTRSVKHWTLNKKKTTNFLCFPLNERRTKSLKMNRCHHEQTTEKIALENHWSVILKYCKFSLSIGIYQRKNNPHTLELSGFWWFHYGSSRVQPKFVGCVPFLSTCNPRSTNRKTYIPQFRRTAKSSCRNCNCSRHKESAIYYLQPFNHSLSSPEELVLI